MLKEVTFVDAVKAVGCSKSMEVTENGYRTMMTVGLENGDLFVGYF